MAKLTELRDMSDEQLGLTLKDANEHLFRLRIQSQTEKLDAPSELRRNRRLVAFDMDSTLIQAEVIDELAKRAGVGEQVAAITERALRGEMDFKESLRQRVCLLKGLPESALA